MWSENTYSSFFNNKINDKEVLKKGKDAIMFYQKASLLLITASSLIIIIQNRKKLSLEIIFLLTIFIGGFAFHILWEAKSRYIIPYIVILMPITAVEINKFKIFKNIKYMGATYSRLWLHIIMLEQKLGCGLKSRLHRG